MIDGTGGDAGFSAMSAGKSSVTTLPWCVGCWLSDKNPSLVPLHDIHSDPEAWG